MDNVDLGRRHAQHGKVRSGSAEMLKSRSYNTALTLWLLYSFVGMMGHGGKAELSGIRLDQTKC